MLSLPPLHYYPILTTCVFTFTVTLTYVIAVVLKHTEVDWPYISDTSTHPPESCIFSQLGNLGALLVGIVVYIRYKQVHEFYLNHNIGSRDVWLNKIALFLGWTMAFGVSLVANFQETTVKAVHLIGVIFALGIGTVYMWFQVYASAKLTSITHGENMRKFRFALATLCAIGFILMGITGELASKYFHGKDPSKWYPKDGGWHLHLVSTFTEWILAIIFNLFLISFVPEFKQVTLDSPRICVRVSQARLLVDPDQTNAFQASYAESITSTDENVNPMS